jgi:4-amino-4-deoxy-L-arabinose transferase-like glycosyltransferase
MELILPISSISWRRLTWLALPVILASFVVAVIRLHPANFFGYTEDDSIYFSSAKALAEGKGYVLASFPGAPAATKYPVFYPWILSWVWRWNSSFPANLAYAIAISVAFGLIYLTVAFLFLRGLRGIGDGEALLLTGFCALHPLIIFYSGSVLSDIPFGAFALAALLLAEMALQQRQSTALAASCGLLAGLAMLTRVFGVPIAAGIVLAFVLRRAWRKLFIVCSALAPFLGALGWHAIFSRIPVSPASGPAASSSVWVHTWTYYTSYFDAWKEAIPTFSVFVAMLKNNAIVLLRTPGDYFVYPWPLAEHMAGTILATVVTVIVLKGILREARPAAVTPIQLALPFYALLALLWNYPQCDRFFIPFFPLFAAGVWIEGKHILRLARSSMAANEPSVEKILAVAFYIVLAAFAFTVGLDYTGGIRSASADKSRERSVLLQDKREAYNWLSRFTDSGARVVAYEDASEYLYAGRSSVRPFTFTTEEFYEPARLRRDLGHIADVSRAVGADYWIVSDDDYDIGWGEAYVAGSARMREMTRVLPVVFSSKGGHLRIYSLSCIQHPDTSGCESARVTLFPADGDDTLLGKNLRPGRTASPE